MNKPGKQKKAARPTGIGRSTFAVYHHFGNLSKMKLPRSLPLSALLLIVLIVLTSARSHATPVRQLEPVGSTTIKVLFWTICENTLYTGDGEYRGIEPGMALKVDYRRKISSDQLVSVTRSLWRDLGIYEPELSEQWLQELDRLIPDVRRGDTVTLYVENDMSATFYFNDTAVGQVSDAGFTEKFLAIWLAENTSYPDKRSQLIGLN